MPRSATVPSYRLHKPSGQAVVTVRDPSGDRRDVYLGEYNSPDSRREYARVIAEMSVSPLASPCNSDIQTQNNTSSGVSWNPSRKRITIDQVILAFWRHAEDHYRRVDGTTTQELVEYKQSMGPLRALYGPTPAHEFGPLGLKAVRQKMIEAGLCRTTINNRIRRLKHVFKWAVAEELVPASVHQALLCVSGLQKGRTKVPEPDPIRPVAEERVRATLPFLRPQVRGMVELQLVTGMRPGEVVAIRPADIDQSGEVWVYRPVQHKNTYRGKPRVIPIGPKARAILEKFSPPNSHQMATEFFFRPGEAVSQLHAERTKTRVTPRFKSHMTRNKAKRTTKPSRPPGH